VGSTRQLPFFDDLRDGSQLASKVDTYEGGLKLSTDLDSSYLTVSRDDFEDLTTTVIPSVPRSFRSAAPGPLVSNSKARHDHWMGWTRPRSEPDSSWKHTELPDLSGYVGANRLW
jgi:hypothetical protein